MTWFRVSLHFMLILLSLILIFAGISLKNINKYLNINSV
jgi:hypothetical protein